MLVKQLSFYGILNRSINKTASERIVAKFDSNARYIRFRAIGCLEKAGFNANHDGFPYSEFEDDRFGYGYKSFIGKNAHVEHNSHEGVTGKIGEVVDAYLNRFKLPDGYKSWKELAGYDKWKLRKEILEMEDQRLGDIEALMKIDLNLLNSNIISNSTKEKLKKIVNNLDSGKMLFCSMGCNADYSVCTVCGNIARYEKDYCEHIKTKLRGTQYMTTANSIRDLLQKDLIRPEFLPFFVYSKYDINEILNGYSNRGVVVKAAEINYGIQFFELSVVSNPAFSAAIMIEKIASTSNMKNYALFIPIHRKDLEIFIGLHPQNKICLVEFDNTTAIDFNNKSEVTLDTAVKEASSRIFLKELNYKDYFLLVGPMPISNIKVSENDDIKISIIQLNFENKEPNFDWINYGDFKSLIYNDKDISIFLLLVYFIFDIIVNGAFIPIKKVSGLYRISDNDILYTRTQTKELLKKISNLNDELIDYLLEKDKFLIKTSVKGTVVNIYEVEYPPPKDKNKETQQLAKYLDEYEDFVGQFLYPGIRSDQIIIDVIYNKNEK